MGAPTFIPLSFSVTSRLSQESESLAAVSAAELTTSAETRKTVKKDDEESHTSTMTGGKKVTFDERLHIRFTISRHDMSASEISDTWLSEREFAHIRRSAHYLALTIKRCPAEFTIRERQEYARGLEGYIGGSQALIRDQSMSFALNAVLKEQAWQWEHQQPYDDSGLRSAYSEISKLSHELAHAVALQDHTSAASETHV
jgi:hypothetical protein